MCAGGVVDSTKEEMFTWFVCVFVFGVYQQKYPADFHQTSCGGCSMSRGRNRQHVGADSSDMAQSVIFFHWVWRRSALSEGIWSFQRHLDEKYLYIPPD